MEPVLFMLYFSVLIQYTFSDVDTGVRLEFRMSGGLFNHQHFKSKTLTRTSIICDLLFADDATLVAMSLQEAQELMDHFSIACKAFGLTISIKKMEVVHQPKPMPKQIRGVRQQQTTQNSPTVHTAVDGQDLKYVKSLTYLGSKVNHLASLDGEIVNRTLKKQMLLANFIIAYGMSKAYP